MRKKRLIQFYITDRCNSRCKTCNIWRDNKSWRHNDLNVTKIMDTVLANIDADFVIGGGEPLLHNEFDKLLFDLQTSGANYTLLSNAIALYELQDYIHKYEIPNITLSFDGLKHDDIRGSKHNKDKVLKAIDFIRDISDSGQKNLKLSYTLSKHNAESFCDDMDYIKNELGFDKVYFCLAQPMGLLKTDKGFKEDLFNLNIVLKRMDMLYDKDKRFILSILNGNKKKCDSTTSVFTIYSNGDVVRCQSFLSKDVLGNIYKTKFENIVGNNAKSLEPLTCPYECKCNLVCQRRYD